MEFKKRCGQLNKHVSVRPQTSRPWYPIVYARWAQSKVTAYTMLVPVGENVTLFSDFSLEIFDPFL